MLVEEPADRQPLEAVPEPPPARPFESSLLRDEVPLPPPAVSPTQARMAEEPVVPASTVPPPTEPAPSAPSEPATPRPSLAAWVVQVGSFSRLENARKLVARLRKAGLQVLDPERIELRGKVLYRVQVGPVLERKRAEAMLPKVNKAAGTQGRVRSYP
jgi:DedD protein